VKLAPSILAADFARLVHWEGNVNLHRTVQSVRVRPECELELDEGIDPETARLCVEAGANVLVAGSSIFGSNETVPEAMNRLRAGRE
jgi:pentose-5-phosphate-3-epimerase